MSAPDPTFERLAQGLRGDELHTLDVAELDAILGWITASERKDAVQLTTHLGLAKDDPEILWIVYQQLDRHLFTDGVLQEEQAGVAHTVPLQVRRTRYRRLMAAFHPDRQIDLAVWLTPRSQAIVQSYTRFRREGRESPAAIQRPTAGIPVRPAAAPSKRPRVHFGPGLMTLLRHRFGRVYNLQTKVLVLLVLAVFLPILPLYLAKGPPPSSGLQPPSDSAATVDAPHAALDAIAAALAQEEAAARGAWEQARANQQAFSAARLSTQPGLLDPSEADSTAAEVAVTEPATAKTSKPKTPAPVVQEPAAGKILARAQAAESAEAQEALVRAKAVEAAEAQEAHARAQAAEAAEAQEALVRAKAAEAAEAQEADARAQAVEAAAAQEADARVQAVEAAAAQEADARVQAAEAAAAREVAVRAQEAEETAARAVTVRRQASEAAILEAAERQRATQAERQARQTRKQEVLEPLLTAQEIAPAPVGATAATPVNESVAAGASGGPAAIPDLAIRGLIESYRSAFEHGDVEGFLHHFSDNPRENANQGLAWFEQNFRNLVAQSRARRLRIEIATIQPVGPAWQVNGHFDLQVEYSRRPLVQVTGAVRYTVRNLSSEWQIESIDY